MGRWRRAICCGFGLVGRGTYRRGHGWRHGDVGDLARWSYSPFAVSLLETPAASRLRGWPIHYSQGPVLTQRFAPRMLELVRPDRRTPPATFQPDARPTRALFDSLTGRKQKDEQHSCVTETTREPEISRRCQGGRASRPQW